MKYKNHKIGVVLLALGVLSTSCETYLEEENKTSLSIESAISNSDTFDQLVASVYERARETTTHYQPDMYYSLEDLGTDIVTRGTEIAGVDAINDYVNFNALNGVVSVYWKNQYSIISAANIAIDQAAVIEGLDSGSSAIGIAESKFFRAIAYFNLVENFGGVPLILQQVKTPDSDYTRDSEEAIYTQIVQDLRDAFIDTPDNTDAYGRVTKDAVRHFLSRVLLTRGYKSFGTSSDYAEAASLAENIITNHPLVSSFASLVDISNQRNSEVVFAYLFGNNSVSRGWGNSRHMLYKFRFFDYPGLTRTRKGLGPMPTPFYYNLFEDDDQRAEATFSREILATEDYTGKNGESVTAGERAIYFPKVAWTQVEIDAVPYAVINPDTYFTSNGTTVVHFPQFTKFDDLAVPFTQPDQASIGERDMVMMRSGEAYLIAAEAYLQANDAGSAASLLTTLRNRAGLVTPVVEGDVDLDFILDERARELTGEVNRWMDLKRTGKLMERTLLHNPHAALNNALSPHHLLRPIPQNEIDLTGGSITQNPNY